MSPAELAASTSPFVERRWTLWAQLGAEGAAAFDAEGRLLTARIGPDYFRRGLDNQVVRIRRGPGFPLPWSFSRVDPDPLFREVGRLLPDPAQGATARARTMAARAAAGLAASFGEDARRFAATVGPVPVLPPNHSRSVVVRLTEGCAWNVCRFCTLYSDVPFRVKSAAEFGVHLGSVLDYFGEGAGMRPSVFVGEASLLEAGVDRAIEALELLGERARVLAQPPADAESIGFKGDDPRVFAGVYAFSDVKRAAALTPAAARRLAGLGVRRLYLGVESGDDQVLRLVKKPHRAADVRAAIGALHRGGIGAGVILLAGAGGRALRDRHRAATVELLAGAGIDRRDFLFLSPLDDKAAAGPSGGGEPMSPIEQAEEVLYLRAALKRALGADLRIADYQLDAFVY